MVASACRQSAEGIVDISELIPAAPSLVRRLEDQPAHEICDDVHTGHVRAGNGHGSVRVLEALRGFERGPFEFEPRPTHRGVEPRCMAAARGKAPAVVHCRMYARCERR